MALWLEYFRSVHTLAPCQKATRPQMWSSLRGYFFLGAHVSGKSITMVLYRNNLFLCFWISKTPPRYSQKSYAPMSLHFQWSARYTFQIKWDPWLRFRPSILYFLSCIWRGETLPMQSIPVLSNGWPQDNGIRQCHGAVSGFPRCSLDHTRRLEGLPGHDPRFTVSMSMMGQSMRLRRDTADSETKLVA